VEINVQKLKPAELCGLLNSTPLGEVIDKRRLQRHRERAGLRIGAGGHIDLFRYLAWLFQQWHTPKPPAAAEATALDLDEAAQGAAALACGAQRLRGHGQKFTRKHQDLITALLTEPTHAKAAAKAGVSKATLSRWLLLPEFQAAYRQACHTLLEASVGRMQAASGLLVHSAMNVALHGRRDSDRARACFGLLDRAQRGVPAAHGPQHGHARNGGAALLGTAGAVKRLESMLEQLDQADLPLADKARLTATLTDALLRARKDDDVNQRLDALETLLRDR
jgi:hypothetical protein